MSNARNLSDLLGTGSTIATAKIADDAITSAKLAAGAAPVTGFRNLLINGDMTVSQRKFAGAKTVSNNSNEGYSIVDRWALNFNNGCAGAVTFDHVTDAPDGFSRSAKLQCSTTNTSFSTHHYCEFRQRIEAQNVTHLAFGTSSAKQLIFSWYMKAVSHSNPITVRFRTLDGTTEYYAKSYTPTDSWARYTCVIPGSTSATIDHDNGAGFEVSFVLAAASGSTGGASADSTAWTTTRINHRDNISNFLNSTNNIIYFTGCQLEASEGTTATEYEHRPYVDELARCQRYFYSSLNSRTNVGTATSTGHIGTTTSSQNNYAAIPIIFPVKMRAGPTVNTYDDDGTVGKAHYAGNGRSASVSPIGQSGGRIYVNNITNGGEGSRISCYFTAECELG